MLKVLNVKMPTNLLSLDCSNLETYAIFSHNGWYCFWLEDLLKETDSFFFEGENNGK